MSREINELLTRGEDFAAKDDLRGAVSFFNAALRGASQAPGLPAATIERLRSAQAFIRNSIQQFEQALDQASSDHGVDEPAAALRLSPALDLVKGKGVDDRRAVPAPAARITN